MSTKVKILEEQLDKVIYDLLSEDYLIINESSELTKSDVEQIAKRETKNFFASSRSPELENRVKQIVKNMIKNDANIERIMVNVAKNVLVQLYKALWTKRSFWANDLKNTAN